jgi:hypothetical protein
MRTQIAFAVVFVLQAGAHAQSQPKAIITSMYERTLDGLQTATTAADIERIVDAIDAPDWVGINPDGTRLTREEAKRELVRSLAGPRGVQPTIDILWFNQAGNAATSVAWVFGKSQNIDTIGEFGPKGARHEVLAGALVRDSWILTSGGWRRRMHEKIFPNRILAVDGKSVVFPLPR